MKDKTYQLTLHMSDGSIVNVGEIAVPAGTRGYEREFTKDDFSQIGTSQQYVLAIPKSEHGLTKPYVEKVLINKSADNEETTTFQTSVAVGEKTLSTGTVKIYITINLDNYTEYSGKIYLRGE